MFGKIKSFAAMFVTVLTLCAFAMPVICAPAHAHNQTTSTSAKSEMPGCDMGMDKKADTHTDQSHHKSGKAGDNCCVGHHCCTAKLATPVDVTAAFGEASTVPLNPFVNQVVFGFDIHGLDRPPKHLV